MILIVGVLFVVVCSNTVSEALACIFDRIDLCIVFVVAANERLPKCVIHASWLCTAYSVACSWFEGFGGRSISVVARLWSRCMISVSEFDLSYHVASRSCARLLSVTVSPLNSETRPRLPRPDPPVLR